jgi:hypothetical protein
MSPILYLLIFLTPFYYASCGIKAKKVNTHPGGTGETINPLEPNSSSSTGSSLSPSRNGTTKPTSVPNSGAHKTIKVGEVKTIEELEAAFREGKILTKEAASDLATKIAVNQAFLEKMQHYVKGYYVNNNISQEVFKELCIKAAIGDSVDVFNFTSVLQKVFNKDQVLEIIKAKTSNQPNIPPDYIKTLCRANCEKQDILDLAKKLSLADLNNQNSLFDNLRKAGVSNKDILDLFKEKLESGQPNTIQADVLIDLQNLGANEDYLMSIDSQNIKFEYDILTHIGFDTLPKAVILELINKKIAEEKSFFNQNPPTNGVSLLANLNSMSEKKYDNDVILTLANEVDMKRSSYTIGDMMLYQEGKYVKSMLKDALLIIINKASDYEKYETLMKVAGKKAYREDLIMALSKKLSYQEVDNFGIYFASNTQKVIDTLPQAVIENLIARINNISIKYSANNALAEYLKKKK